MSLISNEPVVTSVVAMEAAAVGLFVAFGGHVTPDQTFAMSQFLEAGIGLAFLVRSKVTPASRVPTPIVVPTPAADPLATSTATGA